MLINNKFTTVKDFCDAYELEDKYSRIAEAVRDSKSYYSPNDMDIVFKFEYDSDEVTITVLEDVEVPKPKVKKERRYRKVRICVNDVWYDSKKEAVEITGLSAASLYSAEKAGRNIVTAKDGTVYNFKVEGK